MNGPAIATLVPDWPAPPGVRACTTLRGGGHSRPPYAGLNLAEHVGDAADAVAANRRLLGEHLQLPAPPAWLVQVHGTRVLEAGAVAGHTVEADGAYALHPQQVCAVLTADCLPVLLCDRRGKRVAAVHAGWRGLAGGIVEAAVEALAVPGAELLAWLGPAIGPDSFEVGEEVRAQFIAHDPQAEAAFRPSPAGRWLADLYALARLRLAERGVVQVFGGQWCTYRDAARFFSYRRDGATGRMATLIWLER